ncbi:hypothetical protein [Mycobacterium seoulense]|uniref:Uncharacterized protein n=1 Tax=Mycobacterium seoulense TaxID=386911 RepID=A0A7I7NX74_9MYCO|nr:hypothetical protein [Mycobacterium seoulense]MCV7436080.1 hypothetical protein [Mycobacterium seoulense]BBY01049.1 hypothetical protein MSEO_15480 [Mycobacterium seoulense]
MNDHDEAANSEFGINEALNERRQRTTAKTRTRWGEGLGGQRAPDYLITVTTGRGRKKHTFILVADDEADPDTRLHWERVTEKIRYDKSLGYPVLLSRSEPLPGVVPLAQGVDVRAITLVIIFEALVSKEHHHIDLAKIHRIASDETLGGRIARLHTLSPEQRRIAEPALYAEILARLS